MPPDPNDRDRTAPAVGGEGLWPAGLADAERAAIEQAFTDDTELRADTEALLKRLRLDLRSAFAFAFARALIGPPALAVPAGALMPALDETICVAIAGAGGAER